MKAACLPRIRISSHVGIVHLFFFGLILRLPSHGVWAFQSSVMPVSSSTFTAQQLSPAIGERTRIPSLYQQIYNRPFQKVIQTTTTLLQPNHHEDSSFGNSKKKLFPRIASILKPPFSSDRINNRWPRKQNQSASSLSSRSSTSDLTYSFPSDGDNSSSIHPTKEGILCRFWTRASSISKKQPFRRRFLWQCIWLGGIFFLLLQRPALAMGGAMKSTTGAPPIPIERCVLIF